MCVSESDVSECVRAEGGGRRKRTAAAGRRAV